MTTLVYFTLWGEPTEMITIWLLDQECRFREIVLQGYSLHRVFLQPSVMYTDSCRIAVERLSRECVYSVLLYFHCQYSCYIDYKSKVNQRQYKISLLIFMTEMPRTLSKIQNHRIERRIVIVNGFEAKIFHVGGTFSGIQRRAVGKVDKRLFEDLYEMTADVAIA